MDDFRTVCLPLDEQTGQTIARRTYKIVQATSSEGICRQNWVGCIVTDLWFVEYRPDAFTCYLTVIKTNDDKFCLADIHTSRIQQIWQQSNALHIQTKNTLYVLEETAPVKFEPIQATDLLELYLVNGKFFAGFLYDETGSAHPLKVFTHTGMFNDSQLIFEQENSEVLVCRYFLEWEGIRFYGNEFPRRPMLLHNLDTAPLKICLNGSCTVLEPMQQVHIDPKDIAAQQQR